MYKLTELKLKETGFIKSLFQSDVFLFGRKEFTGGIFPRKKYV